MGNEYVKSPLNYVGGKYKMLPKLIPLFPEDIDVFVDMFAGGLNVGANVNAGIVVANDLETKVIDLFEYFKGNSFKVIDEEIVEIINKYGLSNTNEHSYSYYGCDSSKGLSSYNKEKFKKLREDYNSGQKSPLMFYTMLIYAFNNQIRFNSNGEFNMPCNKRDYNKNIKKNLNGFINVLNNKNLKLTNKHYREFDCSHLTEDSFVYLDPPYLITNAAYNENNAWNQLDDEELMEYCNELDRNSIKFGMSNVFSHKGKVNEKLIKWAEKYNVHHLDFNYKNSNYQSIVEDSKSDEVFICNY